MRLYALSAVKICPFKRTRFDFYLNLQYTYHTRTPLEPKGTKPHDALALVIWSAIRTSILLQQKQRIAEYYLGIISVLRAIS